MKIQANNKYFFGKMDQPEVSNKVKITKLEI